MSEKSGSSLGACLVAPDCRQPSPKIVPVRSRPKDSATLRTLEKLLILPCNKGRDQESSLVAWNGNERDVAIRTTIVPPTVHIEIELEIPMELVQLSFDYIARDQGMPTAEEFAQHQASIAREQPTMFAHYILDQRLVGDCLFIRCVVTENAQPAYEATEHRIGDEAHG